MTHISSFRYGSPHEPAANSGSPARSPSGRLLSEVRVTYIKPQMKNREPKPKDKAKRSEFRSGYKFAPRDEQVTCPMCGKEFARKTNNQKFCSEACKRREYKIHLDKSTGRPGIPVMIDGVYYANAIEGAKAIGCCQSTLSKYLREGKTEYKGHKVRYA